MRDGLVRGADVCPLTNPSGGLPCGAEVLLCALFTGAASGTPSARLFCGACASEVVESGRS